MQLNLLFSIWFFLLFTFAAANSDLKLYYTKKEIVVKSCLDYVGKQATLYGKKDKAGYCNVKNQPALGTMAHCLVQGFVNNTELQESGINYFINTYCKDFNLTRAAYNASYVNATKLAVDPTKEPGFNKTKLFSAPIKLKTQGIVNTYNSQSTRWMNYTYSLWYGIALNAYWFVIIFVASICNLCCFLFPRFVKSLNGKVSKTFRKYVTVPATFGKDHAAVSQLTRYVWACIPTRLETLIIFGWVVLAVVFSCVNITRTHNNTIWKTREAEMGRKIADRSGFLACFLFPVQILFAGRNNFLQWISGWDYSRFLALHRWTSRVTFLLSVVHTIAMSCSGIALGKYQSRNSQPYVQWGYVSLIAMVIILISGQTYVRKNYYELFLLTHIVMAILFLAGGWIHVKKDGDQVFFYAAVACWGLDRLVRLLRLAAFGVKKATIEVKAGEILKVTVPTPKYWKATPGGHAFIHFLRPSCFWQSHPFTLVDTSANTKQNTISFYIKIKGGVTHGLYRYLEQQPNNISEVNVLIEGPYGQRLSLDRVDNVVFVAGGNGIPGLFSEAMHIASKKSNNGTKVVKFHWIIPHWKSIEWFMDEIKQFENTIVQTVIHITRPDSDLYSSSQSSDDEKDQDKSGERVHQTLSHTLRKELSFVEFHEGKPSIKLLVKQEINDLEGPICFSACAHPALCDEVRATVANSLDLAKDRIDYHEKIQTW